MTIHRKAKCLNPNCPHERNLYFNDWVRQRLPDSETGFVVSDIDFVLVNFNLRKIMLLEVKQFGKPVETWQRKLFSILNKALRLCAPKGYKYLEYHLITFERTTFENGLVYLDNKPITEEQLITFLSMN